MGLCASIGKLDRHLEGRLERVGNPRVGIPIRYMTKELDKEIESRARMLAKQREHRGSMGALRKIIVGNTASQPEVELGIYRTGPLKFLFKIIVCAHEMVAQS